MARNEWTWKRTADDQGNEQHVVNGGKLKTARRTRAFLRICEGMGGREGEACNSAVEYIDQALALLAPEPTGPSNDGTNPME